MSLSLSLPAFKRLAARHPGRLLPVCRSFLADTLTPVTAFRRLCTGSYGFLLESVERGERMGRYSFVGGEPEVIFAGNILPRPTYSISGGTGTQTGWRSGDPLAQLERYMAERPALEPEAALQVPSFAGGAVGYLGYDCVRLFEPRLFRKAPRRHSLPDLPDLWVPVYRTIAAFDHVKNAVWVVHHADPREGGAAAAYRRAVEALDRTARRLAEPAGEDLTGNQPAAVAAMARSNLGRRAFERAVRRAQEYIAAGDIIQVVLSQRFSRRTRALPFEVYRSLRAVNPSPYMFYLKYPTAHLVGSSPEVMVRVEEGRITVRPIAGTRPRGKTPEEDERLAAELLADEKELAEHAMLLDLGRNDVGRVAEFGSVKVTEQMTVENYSHVMHIVSNVTGRLRPGFGALAVLRASHPAGTVSGAPKIRAMEIIDELEPHSRGPYAGAVGLLDFRGNLNTAIAIRTFCLLPRADGAFDAHVQAGAGIVADSVPAREYEETRNKARALLRSLDLAEARATPPVRAARRRA